MYCKQNYNKSQVPHLLYILVCMILYLIGHFRIYNTNQNNTNLFIQNIIF